MDLFFIRLVFIVVLAAVCYFLQPFGVTRWADAGVGALIATAVVLFEWRLRIVSLKRLIGAVIGSITGIFGAYLFSVVIGNAIQPGNTRSFLQLLDRKSTRLNSSHIPLSRMPSSA